MKKFVKYIVLLAATMLAVSCTPDYPTLDEGNLPVASELDVVIDVDQATNLVTFTLKNQGMTPMWIFPEEGKPDDISNKKKYSVTINGYTARFRDAGDYSVEVKAYNYNGVSVGSVIKEFTLENTYRDPFDQSKYLNAVSNNGSQEWMWNSTVDGHFGCGGSVANPLERWNCKAGEKEGVGLYDDRMTFDKDGNYTFNPGEGGTVYVNWGNNTVYPGWSGNENDDYQVAWEEYTSKYHFEQNWNDAGIEEIYLVLEEGNNLSYIASQDELSNPRYLVVENKPADMKKKLNLVWAGTGIAWKKEFVPAVKVLTAEELLAGSDAAGKVWVMDSAAQGHLGCGESVDNAAGWWSAGPAEKTGTGLYDDEVTFYADCKYVYNPGADGKMYINWGVTAIGPNPGVEPDIDIEWPLTESTYTFEDNTITLAEQTPLIYVPSDVVWNAPIFHVKELTESRLVLVAENPGCYWQMILRARDYKEPAASIGGVEFANGAADLTIAQGEVLTVSGVDLSTMWIDPDFFEQVDDTNLKFLAMDGDYRIQKLDGWFKVIPMVNGARPNYNDHKALWIIGDGGGKPEGEAHLIGWNTGEAPLPLARISENEYRITLWMKAEGGSIKVFGQSDWGVEWTQDKYGVVTDNGLFNIPGDDGNIHTVEGGPTAGFYTFYFTDNGGILDMRVEKFQKVVTQWDPAAACNMWNSTTFTNEFYYAPGWAQIADMGFEDNDGRYLITLPEATSDRWQAQVKFHTEMSSSADKFYDIQVKMMANLDHPAVMIKFTQDGDDNNFYCADESNALVADEEMVFRMANVPGKDMPKTMLVLDFGRCAAGTEVEVYDIIFQEHTETVE